MVAKMLPCGNISSEAVIPQRARAPPFYKKRNAHWVLLTCAGGRGECDLV